MFVGTLPIVFRFGSKLRNDFEYAGQPSRLVHSPPAADAVEDECDLASVLFLYLCEYRYWYYTLSLESYYKYRFH